MEHSQQRTGAEHLPDAGQEAVRRTSDEGSSQGASCGESCGCGPTLDRRQLLHVTGAGLVSLGSFGAAGRLLAQAAAQPGRAATAAHERLIPADKRLAPEWVRGLFERGARRTWRGKELDTIAMPIGGITAGQLYLCGDGTLGSWYIFNKRFYSGAGSKSYRYRTPDSPVGQGFALTIERDDGTVLRPLSRKGFADISFVGEYPIGRVSYSDPEVPVRIEMEAFSPFIPLNAADSALPATLFHITLANTSDKPVRASLAGWLENAVCFYTADALSGTRSTTLLREEHATVLLHTAAGENTSEPEAVAVRPTVVLADFEGPDYGDWKTTGTAFGTHPASGTLPAQNSVLGFLGKGLVNTHIDENGPQGTLTSPRFKVERRFISFLIGGGSHAGRTCINLLVDERVVRTATGSDGEPLSWHTWDVAEFAGREARIQILDLESGSWGHINIDQIEMSDRARRAIGKVEETDDYGSMALALAGAAAAGPADAEIAEALKRTAGEPLTGDSTYSIRDKRSGAIVSPTVELPPGGKHTFVFALAWHFPNHKTLGQDTGHAYAARFGDAAEVARYVLNEHERLAGQTRLWHATYYDSTLPYWLLDRVGSTVSCLASCTCEWWRDGRFWAWEGVYCCPGTCTHVWNYAHAMARLFPELERSVREQQDLGIGLQPGGLVGFRGEHNVTPAADGQMGTILKCYREHQASADSAFLRRNWAAIRKTLEYALHMDGDANGLVEGEQHNTFDIEFYGPNTFVGSLYLAALLAGEAMAHEMGEDDFARRLREVFERGSRASVEKLWNGEYFIQIVDLREHPENQYADGCISDQLFGQGWAHQLGLGYIYPREHVVKALQSVWRYNWAPDLGPYSAVHKPARFFADPGEAGLFTCTWPRSEYLESGVRFKDEVWTGIEYQVAGHMIAEGMVTEGLAIVRAIDDRYQPHKHNPFNEIECGDHYARALASWSVLLSLAGYEYHGPKGHLAFGPRLTPEDFRTAFTAAEGWGTFAQQRTGNQQRESIQVRWGRLRLANLGFVLTEAKNAVEIAIKVGDRDIASSHRIDGGRVVIELEEELTLREGETLEVVIS